MGSARRSFGINGLAPKDLQSRRTTALSWKLAPLVFKERGGMGHRARIGLAEFRPTYEYRDWWRCAKIIGS